MHDKKKSKPLNFSGFSGYYGFMSAHDGYGGFNYLSDFLYMNQSTWTAPGGAGYENGWCDTGYQNEAAMSKAKSLGWIYEYGLMESSNGHSFSMKSMNVAESWSQNSEWNIISYTEKNGSLSVKATDQIVVSFTGESLKMSNLGGKGDFKGIAAVAFEFVSYGSGGNTCTYGTPVEGVQLCVGDIKVKFSKKADLQNNHGQLLSPYMLHHQTHPVAHMAAAQHSAHSFGNGGAGNHSDAHHNSTGYHSQLLSLGHDHGLTSQFHLPTVEHFMS